MTDETRSTEPDFDRSDEEWLARLADSKASVSDPKVAREAEAVSAAIRREAATVAGRVEAAFPADVRERRLDELLGAMKREGLIPAEASAHAGVSTRPAAPTGGGLLRGVVAALSGRWQWAAPAAIAASVLLAVVLVRPWEVAVVYDSPPVWRGERKPPPIVVRDKSPQARAEALAKAFAGARLSARLYQQERVFIVDVDVPPESVDSARAEFEKIGAKVEAGQYRVEVRPTD